MLGTFRILLRFFQNTLGILVGYFLVCLSTFRYFWVIVVPFGYFLVLLGTFGYWAQHCSAWRQSREPPLPLSTFLKIINMVFSSFI